MASFDLTLWTGQEIAAALAVPELPSLQGVTGISIDTRTLKPGDLYIALKGDIHDGHAFVAQAFAKGAVAAIVDHVVVNGQPSQIVVEDTLKALRQLGAFARHRSKATFIAVTGSVGKTSTKELLTHVLKEIAPTFSSPLSYNNHWGVPFSLATMLKDAVYGIFEVGMNHRGEIAPLSSLVRPHIGVVTAIADAHIAYLTSRQAIAEEKADIFSSAPVPGLAILNQDIPEFDLIRDRAKSFGVSQILGFGKTEKAFIRLITYQADPTGSKGQVTAQVGGRQVTYTLPQLGEHVALNSLVALAVGEALGLDQKRILAHLESLPAVAGRGKQHPIPVGGGEFLLIDDAYNANLLSMQAGLSVLASLPLPPNGRRLVILGEMLELGDQASSQHRQLMEDVLSHPVDLVFAVGGPVMETAFRETVPGHKAGGYAPHIDMLVPGVMETLRPGDIVFVKGSKGSRVSKLVEMLVARKNLKEGDMQ